MVIGNESARRKKQGWKVNPTNQVKKMKTFGNNNNLFMNLDQGAADVIEFPYMDNVSPKVNVVASGGPRHLNSKRTMKQPYTKNITAIRNNKNGMQFNPRTGDRQTNFGTPFFGGVQEQVRKSIDAGIGGGNGLSKSGKNATEMF